MPSSTVRRPPQTLRQAKKAYQKSGPRLSEIEIRRIERAAELEERAARMREREHKRKANLKKKAEREEKEREARKRMNIPEPVKGFYVGPSQIRMSGFLDTGIKRKREGVEPETRDSIVGESEAVKSVAKKLDATQEKASRPQLAKLEKPKSRQAGFMDSPILPMAPPKARAPLQARSVNSMLPSKPLFFAEPVKSSITIEDDWDSFLASGTQIARELAAPEVASDITVTTHPPACPSLTPANDDTDFLDMITTQDLDYIDEGAPFESTVSKEELKHTDSSKKRSVGDNGKGQSEDKVAEPNQGNECKPESNYGDDSEYNPSQGTENNNSASTTIQEPRTVHSYAITPSRDIPPYSSHINPAHPPNLLPENQDSDSDSDFDNGIKDDEVEKLVGSCETKSALPPPNLRSSTPPIAHTSQNPGPPESSSSESFNDGDFDLSTQEMRDLEPDDISNGWELLELSTQQERERDRDNQCFKADWDDMPPLRLW